MMLEKGISFQLMVNMLLLRNKGLIGCLGNHDQPVNNCTLVLPRTNDSNTLRGN